MKRLQLIFLFSIIVYCLADNDQYDCESKFSDALRDINENQCKKIDSTCRYNDTHTNCITPHDCSEGSRTSTSACQKIIPTNFYLYKCDYANNECSQKFRTCSDWKKLGDRDNPQSLSTDICSDLSPGDDGDRCYQYEKNPGNIVCEAHFDRCESIGTNDNSKCDNNIPKNFWEKCVWEKRDGDNSASCHTDTRICGPTLYVDAIKGSCNKLQLASTETDKVNKECIYDDNIKQCKVEYKECRYQDFGTDTDNCENYMPLNESKTGYEYSQKCTYDKSSEKCQPVQRKCTEFNKSPIPIPTDLLNDKLCSELIVSDDNYFRCAYNEENNECYEEYKSCGDYISNKVETKREGCERIVLPNKTEKCVYDINKDECVTKPIYEKCEDYVGKDKKTCESIILSPTTRPYCILDKDSNCIERPLFCSEAFNEDDCINVARASDNNKRCAYDSIGCTNSTTCSPVILPHCYEEYIRCEDYLGDSKYECENIILYNGKKCKWESSRCRTNNKICEDAETEEECELIAEIGVTDTERKVCAWAGNTDKCIETFKYCSDYRETCPSTGNCRNFCANKIKPYDESGKNLDIGFKCIYDDNVGCQKVPVKCNDASNDPILCKLYSDKINDKDKKYCGFFEGSCKEYYQECKYVEFDYPSENSKCTDNIINVEDNNIYGVCKVNTTDGKCIQKKVCEDFRPISTSGYYKDICERLNPHCSYRSIDISLGSLSISYPICEFKDYKEKSCANTTFYTEDENNSEICESIEVSEPFKKCVINEDKSGCEKVYKELPYSTSYTSYSESQGNENQESSSDFPIKGINLILILLCFLF